MLARFKSRLNEAQTHLSASLADGITADRQTDVTEDGVQRPDSWQLRQDGDLGGRGGQGALKRDKAEQALPGAQASVPKEGVQTFGKWEACSIAGRKRGQLSQPSKENLERPSLLN